MPQTPNVFFNKLFIRRKQLEVILCALQKFIVRFKCFWVTLYSFQNGNHKLVKKIK